MTEPTPTYTIDAPIVLTLSWPLETSLNSRIHWAKRAEINSANEFEGGIVAASLHSGPLPPIDYALRLTFCPPDNRRRDLDNMLGRTKKQIDGMCITWSIDDSAIKRITLEWGDVQKPGRVVVTIERLLGGEQCQRTKRE